MLFRTTDGLAVGGNISNILMNNVPTHEVTDARDCFKTESATVSIHDRAL